MVLRLSLRTLIPEVHGLNPITGSIYFIDRDSQGVLGLKPYKSIIFILGTLDWLGSAEPSMSWLVVEVGK